MDIEKFLKSGETELVEFKESFDKKTIETVVAFSSTRGGIIFIGVNNDGDVRGVSIGKETLKDWGNRISQNTESSVIPEINVQNIKGKSIVIIQVQEYPLTGIPHFKNYLNIENANLLIFPLLLLFFDL